MNSSMLAGERRWASQRRGGMTVLGKVAVPKPINLPSQRLENHGLDPSVEIVPKGTVSWGSRSSSSASNPWTSSSLSPNADGGTNSPTHRSGRPSSGGSGTRPSTAGSDRAHDLVQNAWGSNSRPSSASGTFSSNQSSSSSLRPKSAENRPNSAHLSRFAEPVSESSTAWGLSATAERLGVKSSKEDGFSLTSGDFPTLGFDKDNSVKNVESQDRDRPSSASGGINQAKEDTVPNSDVKHGPVNTLRDDGLQNADGIHPSMEKWQGDPHQYPYANIPPQHFDVWRGPPMNGLAGGWYGGPPRGPPFRSHVPPGGFPLDPFPYYHRPQVPPPALAGSQLVPPPGPRGPHSKNGDLYRPQIPDAYPHPSMPFRPGFYPGHPGPMPFDGYYGPPIGHHNNDRDIPYMGMQAAPPVYNGYPPPNSDISNPHDRASGRCPAGKMMTEQLEANQREDACGPKRIHIMSHGECDQREGGGNRGQIMQPIVSHAGRSHLHVSLRKNEWGAEEDTEIAVFAKRTAKHADGPNIIGIASESLIVDPEGKMDGDSVQTHDLTDVHSQRSKMRELAKHRALQLQKEEEERIQEQKAKALAKLEELNRRTLAGDAANLMAERTQVIGDNTPTEQESYTVVGPMIAELNIEQSGFNIVPGPSVAANSNTYQGLESVEVAKNLPLEINPIGISESNESPLPVSEESHDSSTKNGACHADDGTFSRYQRTGYKQRLDSSLQKCVNENSTSDIKSNESPSSDIRPSESNALNASNTVVELPAQQRRKTGKSNKTKPKLDETPAAMDLVPVASDADCGNESIDYGNNSLPHLESPVLTASEPDTKLQAQVVSTSLPNEESQSRASNQWKPHHYRRLPRSQQAHRFTDKLHGSDTVVWAPVRLQKTSKVSDEASQNSVQESANSTKDNNVGQNNSKGKRAEMERYVPKPIAKELAQHGNVQPLSSSVNSSRSIAGSGWEQSGSVSSANPHFRPSVEIERDYTDNHNKHKKEHGTWKQRGSTNSSHMKGGHIGPSPTSEPIIDIPQSKELVQSGGNEITKPNSDAKTSGKDQGATGRGKRHPQRGSRSTGKNPDSENTFSGEIDESSSIQSAVPNVNQIDRNIFSKENRSTGDRASAHWQPKSRPHSANNDPQHNHSDNASQLPTVNVDNNVTQGSVWGNHQEFNREKMPAPVNARPYSPSRDPLDSGECSTNTDDHLERNAPLGSRRNVRQNNHSIRGPDSRGDWSSGHDSRTAFRERQRQNVHYEYQPVDPMKVNKPEKSEEPADAGANNTDQRHRGRGHSHSKRGGSFYRRQSSAAHVGSGRD